MAGTSLGEMSVTIGADISSFVANIGKAQTTFSGFQKQATQIANSITSIGEKAAGFSKSLGDTSGVNRFLSGLSSAGSATTSFIGRLKSGVSGVVDFGSKLGMAVMGFRELGGAAVSAVQSLLGPAAAMEQNQIAFTGLLRDGTKAKNFLNELQQFAASTPFEFNDLISASRRLLAFGFEAQDVKSIMTDLGDTIAGLGGGAAEMDRLVYAMGQIQAKGKLTAEDMAQLTDLGIRGWDMIAKEMGVSTQELMDMTSKGLVPADKAIAALRAGMRETFGGQMAAQSQTFNGMISTLKDTISQAWLAFSGPLFEKAKGALTAIASPSNLAAFQSFAQGAGATFGTMLNNLGTALSPLVSGFQDLGSAIASAFSQSRPFFDALGNFLASVGGAAVSGIAQIFTDIGNTINGIAWADLSENGMVIVDALQGAFEKVAASVATAYNAIKPAIDQIINAFILLAPYVSDFIAGAFTVLGDILANFVVPAIATLITWIGAIVNWFATTEAGIATFKAILITVGVVVGTLLVAAFIAWAIAAASAAIATIAATWPILAIIAAIVAIIALVVLAVENWGTITTWLGAQWQAFATWFMSLWNGMIAWFQGLWSGIVTFFTGIWTNVTTSTQTAWTAIMTLLQSVWNGIVAFFTVAGQILLMLLIGPYIQLYQMIQPVLAPFIAFVTGVFQTIYNIVVALVGMALNWIIQQWQSFVQRMQLYFTALQVLFQMVWTRIVQIVMTAVTPLVTWLSAQWQMIVSTATTIWNSLVTVVSTVWNAISTTITTVWNTIRTNVTAAFTAFVTFFSQKWNEVKTIVATVWTAISTTVTTTWNNIVKAITDKITVIRDAITKPFKDAAAAMGAIIRSLVNTIASWLNKGISAVESFLNNFGQGINWIAEKLGTKGLVPRISIPRVPSYATGTASHPGGPALVGERGREMVFLPRGASVLPNRQTEQFLGRGIPGYAEGAGNPVLDLLNWIGKGARGLVDAALGMFGASSFQLPGVLNRLVSGILNKLIDMAVKFVQGLIDKIKPQLEAEAKSLEKASQTLTSSGSTKMARGGIIAEPIVGFGLNSGNSYAFGERGPEAVIPLTGGTGVGRPIYLTIELDRRVLAQGLLPTVLDEIRLKTGSKF